MSKAYRKYRKIIDKAFSTASKSASSVDTGKNIAYTREKVRINTAFQVVQEKLKGELEEFPWIDNLKPFYKELIDVLVGVDKLKLSLGRVKGVISVIEKIKREELEKLERNRKNWKKLREIRKEAYGRLCSILRKIRRDLEFLEKAKMELRSMPNVKNIPTVVIAGYPNVGKSTLLKQLTNSKPEIAPYPFTTKKIRIGYMNGIQIIDTPGLLDRPFEKRNEIEKQAILALKYLANLIIFVIDPSETCGYSLKDQVSLLESIRRSFGREKVIVVINKIDICERRQIEEIRAREGDAIEISAVKCINIGKVKNIIMSRLGNFNSMMKVRDADE